ncbi:MAG: radical SAM protein [Elusimicrobia bacterium]|nr:radical SAM protein [Elusimicrobiota bacterium]
MEDAGATGPDWRALDRIADYFATSQYDLADIYNHILFESGGSLWTAEQVRSEWAAAAEGEGTPPNVNLYPYIPFCRRRCGFCGDPIVIVRDGAELEAYLARLIAELEFMSPAFQRLPVTAAWLGGGTPTLLDAAQLERLLSTVRSRFLFPEGAEMTLECHPASLAEDKLKTARLHGVSRISLGVQTLDPATLRSINRADQSEAEVLRHIRQARALGFPHGINVDMIMGLPGESPEACLRTLRVLAAEGPDEISVFTITPSGANYVGKFYEGDGAGFERHGALYAGLKERLCQEAETAGYALMTSVPGREWHFMRRGGAAARRHPEADVFDSNLCNRRIFLFGVGSRMTSMVGDRFAYGDITFPGDPFDPSAPMHKGTRLTPRLRMLQFLFHRLRTDGAVDGAEFRAQFQEGLLDAFPEVVQALADRGRASLEGDRLALSRRDARETFLSGIAFLDQATVSDVLRSKSIAIPSLASARPRPIDKPLPSPGPEPEEPSVPVGLTADGVLLPGANGFERVSDEAALERLAGAGQPSRPGVLFCLETLPAARFLEWGRRLRAAGASGWAAHLDGVLDDGEEAAEVFDELRLTVLSLDPDRQDALDRQPQSFRRKLRLLGRLQSLKVEAPSFRLAVDVPLLRANYRDMLAMAVSLKGLGADEVAIHCPDFRLGQAAGEPDAAPTFREAMPFLLRLLLKNAAGPKTTLRLCGFAPCCFRLLRNSVSDKLIEHLAGKHLCASAASLPARLALKSSAFDGAPWPPGRMKIPACSPCRYASTCQGLWRNYALLHGTQEMCAITA